MENNPIIIEYKKRIQESNFFFHTLETVYHFLENEDYKEMRNQFKYDSSDGTSYNFEDFLLLQKSTSYLILYNLVEASITGFVTIIYDEITDMELTYNDVISEIKDLWFSLEYKKLKSTTTNYDQHRDRAKQFISSIVESEKICLSSNDIDFSGNIDFRTINDFFSRIGISITDQRNKPSAGYLYSVKNKRNTIAHGNVSFLDAGRELSFGDLIQYNVSIIELLDNLKEKVKQYIDNYHYKKVE